MGASDNAAAAAEKLTEEEKNLPAQGLAEDAPPAPAAAEEKAPEPPPAEAKKED